MKKIISLLALSLIFSSSSHCMKQSKRERKKKLSFCPITKNNKGPISRFIQRNFKKHIKEATGKDKGSPIDIFYPENRDFKDSNKDTDRAFISFQPEFGCANIIALYVPEDFENNNVSKLLVKKALEKAKEKKLTCAVIETLDDQEASALEQLGFKKEHVREGHKNNNTKHYYLKKDTVDFIEPLDAYYEMFSGYQKDIFTMASTSFGFILKHGREIIGVIEGSLVEDSVYIYNLIVRQVFRRKGFGSILLKKALEYAKENKCELAILATFSFEAKDFYEKHGFKIDFTRTGYENNIQCHFMSKKLSQR